MQNPGFDICMKSYGVVFICALPGIAAPKKKNNRPFYIKREFELQENGVSALEIPGCSAYS